MPNLSRRAALLSGAGLLAGCDTVSDTFDRWFGDPKLVLTGERRSIVAADRGMDPAPTDTRPVNLPPPQPVADWPQAGGSLGHAGGHPQLGPGLSEIWRTSIGDGAAYRRRLSAPPIIADGTVYAMDAFGYVSAVDLARGGRRWRIDTRPDEEGDGALGGGIAFDGGTLYAVTGLAEVMAIDPANGAIKWRAALPAPARGAPTVARGRIFVPTIENQLLALSAEDGSRVWTYRAQTVTTIALGLPAPAVEGDVVVAGFGSGEVVAARIADGRAVWSETLAGSRTSGGGGLADIIAIAAMPVIDRGRVYAMGIGSVLISLDLRSGRRLWEREVSGTETPWAVGDWVFVVSNTAELLCIGRDDGRVRWVRQLERWDNPERRRGAIFWGSPVVAGGRLLIGNAKRDYLTIDVNTGETLATQRSPGLVALQPAFSGETMVVLTDSGDLVAYQGRG